MSHRERRPTAIAWPAGNSQTHSSMMRKYSGSFLWTSAALRRVLIRGPRARGFRWEFRHRASCRAGEILEVGRGEGAYAYFLRIRSSLVRCCSHVSSSVANRSHFLVSVLANLSNHKAGSATAFRTKFKRNQWSALGIRSNGFSNVVIAAVTLHLVDGRPVQEYLFHRPLQHRANLEIAIGEDIETDNDPIEKFLAVPLPVGLSAPLTSGRWKK